ncbi:hypothetical protein MMC25_004480 [Agyrium rufum]|nr:hypothetical protein [Agyrium rufum]
MHPKTHLLPYVLLLALPRAISQITYYSDVPQYTELAPCARSGLNNGFYDIASGDCGNPTAPASLASCACYKDGNSNAIQKSVSFIILSEGYCASTDFDDVASASAVFSIYCAAYTAVAPAPTSASSTTSITAAPGSGPATASSPVSTIPSSSSAPALTTTSDAGSSAATPSSTAPTSGDTSLTSSLASSTLQTSTPSPTGNSTSTPSSGGPGTGTTGSGTGGKSLTTADIILIAFAAVALLISLIAVPDQIRRYKRRQALRFEEQEMMQQQHVGQEQGPIRPSPHTGWSGSGSGVNNAGGRWINNTGNGNVAGRDQYSDPVVHHHHY